MSDDHQDAAALDALNLDELFLIGGDSTTKEGRNRGNSVEVGFGGMMGDIFNDMDFDLGDIMEGIIGGGGGDEKIKDESMMGMDASSFDWNASGVGGDHETSLMGEIDLEKMNRRRSSLNIDTMVNSGGGKSLANRRGARTARANPHLAIFEQQQEELRRSSSGTIKQELSSLIASGGEGGGRGGGGGGKGGRGNGGTIELGGKRRRRRSKRYGIDYKDDSDEDYDSGNDSSRNPLKKRVTRRASVGSPKIVTISEAGARDQLLHPQSSTTATAAQHHQQKHIRHRQEEDDAQLMNRRKTEVKKSFRNYGLPSSRSSFFPFMNLPKEVDGKKRGLRSYACLEKLGHLQTTYGDNANLSVGGIHESDSTNGTDPMTTTPTTASITIISPIYELFGQQFGLGETNAAPTEYGQTNDDAGGGGGGMGMQEQHQHTPSSTLIASLTKSTDAVHRMLHQLHRNGIKERQGEQETHSRLPSSPKQLIDDLANLYSLHVRQAAFLRQNLMNMENWCEDHFKGGDMQKTFPVRRRSVEKVLKELWAHKVESQNSLMIKIQQNQLQSSGSGNGAAVGVGGGKFSRAITATNPLISIKVKVKLLGFRDKPGMNLTANLPCPKRWHTALKRCFKNNTSTPPEVTPPTLLLTAIPPLDTSFFDEATLEVAANELLRSDLMTRKTTTIISADVANEPPPFQSLATASETQTNSTSFISTKTSLDSIIPDPRESVKTNTKKISRKHKKEDIGASTLASSSAKTAPATRGRPSLSASTLKAFADKTTVPPTPLLSTPNIPGYHQVQKNVDDSEDNYRHERHRLLRALYGSILQPGISPANRRSILANEISSTMARLKKDHEQKQRQLQASSSSKRYQIEAIEKQILDLQATYMDDIEIMPESCTTVGLWNYMTKSNYFDVLEKEDDVFIALEGIFQSETTRKEGDLFNEPKDDGTYCWGEIYHSPLPCTSLKRIVTNNHGKEGDDEDSAIELTMTNGKEATISSLMYDRLQSLLVEEDDWSNNSDDDGQEREVVTDETDDDDDALFANLPSYSPEEFVHGPEKYGDVAKSFSTTNNSHTAVKDSLDLSALTLDQRTYIQLCAAGLVDGKLMTFPNYVSSSSSFSDESAPSHIKRTFYDEDDDDDVVSIDTILQMMMVRLSTLNAETNAKVAKLQLLALSHVHATEATATTPISTSHQSLSSFTCQSIEVTETDDETSTVTKHEQLEKPQRKEKEQQDVRISGRVKVGSKRFDDDDEWVPW